jgi:hypothetical protein
MKFGMRHQTPDMWIKSRTQAVSIAEVMHRFNMSTEGAERMLEALVRDRRIVRVEIEGESRWRSL